MLPSMCVSDIYGIYNFYKTQHLISLLNTVYTKLVGPSVKSDKIAAGSIKIAPISGPKVQHRFQVLLYIRHRVVSPEKYKWPVVYETVEKVLFKVYGGSSTWQSS